MKTKSIKLNKSSDSEDMLTLFLILGIILLVILCIIYIYLIIKKNKQKSESFQEKSNIEIIYVFSKTCPHCTKFEPVFDESITDFVKSANDYSVQVQKISLIEMSKDLSIYVDGYPTVLMFIDGKYIKKLVGFHDKNEVDAFLNSV